MAAEPVFYHATQSDLIRKECALIINSVLGFQFHYDSAMSSLNTIQAEILTLIDERSRFATKLHLEHYAYIKNWLSSFFRMLYKAKNNELSYDFLFYGAALTIVNFLDDHHL